VPSQLTSFCVPYPTYWSLGWLHCMADAGLYECRAVCQWLSAGCVCSCCKWWPCSLSQLDKLAMSESCRILALMHVYLLPVVAPQFGASWTSSCVPASI
jgi:hypothetical protein